MAAKKLYQHITVIAKATSLYHAVGAMYKMSSLPKGTISGVESEYVTVRAKINRQYAYCRPNMKSYVVI